MEIPVFIFTGFLDSGKTTLIRDTLESPDFEAFRNLIIRCEDGDEEYSAEYLKKNHAFLATVERESDFTDAFLAECAKKYDPDQVIIEFNGTWKLNTLAERRLPKYWEYAGMFSAIDASTVDMYLANMRPLFMEQFAQTGLIIFNRCDENTDRTRLRRIFKAFNPGVQIMFERADGEDYDEENDLPPYDISGDLVDIDEIDYGIWYLDAMEHPERYMGKHIRFLAQVYKGRNLSKNTFVPGRFIMTCCVNDIRFMGYVCTYEGDFPYKQRDWVKVEVEFGFGYVKQFKDSVPILKLVSIEPAKKAEQDPVYFN